MQRRATLCLLAVLCACGSDRQASTPVAQRLVDLFSEATIEGTPAAPAAIPKTEWTFAAGGERPWRAAGSLRGLRVEDGALVATSAGPSSLLHVAWEPGPEYRDDLLHSVEVRMRASAGGRISFTTSREEDLALGPLLAPGASPFLWSMTSPIVPGETVTTYTLIPVRPQPIGGVRHLVLKPTDAPDAELAIESVRVVFEREHLASVPSGINWQGLGGVFRETLVSRSPETLRFELELPPRPRLDLAVGTLEPGATTFLVTVEPAAGGGDPVTARRTVTAPQRWQELAVPLDAFAARRVRLSLQVEAAREGSLGLWGSPVVRARVDGLDERPQGVIVAILDTLRRDHLDVYGHERETAPTLSRLGAEGVVVEDAISQATWTKVSVPSILTSLYPTSHTVADIPDLLPASADTLAEVFRRAGYATLGFSAIPFTGKMTNLHQGYEVFIERTQDADDDGLARGGFQRKAAQRYVDDLLPWLEAHRDVPFFVVLHVEDPHSPYFAPPPYATLWGEAGGAERYRSWQDEVRPQIDHPLMRQFGMPQRVDLEQTGIDPEAYVELELDAYDGLIRSLDDEIARLVERIEELGLRDDLVLAFISDHGTEFLDHDAHFHGQSVYGELNRVPMLFWGPGFVPAGVRVPATVENVDFMPTILELTELEKPEGAQGQSLVPWFAAAGSESAAAEGGWRRKPAITEKASLPMRGREGFGSLALIDEGWKLIRNFEPPDGVPEVELYDHENDPLNLENVADQHADVVERLSKRLESWRKFAEAARLPSDSDLAATASPAELERLRALGYL
jgi:arylsulfatase A-like enzyme